MLHERRETSVRVFFIDLDRYGSRRGAKHVRMAATVMGRAI